MMKFTDKPAISPPRLGFTNLRGRTLSPCWEVLADECLVNSGAITYKISAGTSTRINNFKRWTITTSPATP